MKIRPTICCAALLALCSCNTTPQKPQHADALSLSNPVTRKQAIKTAYAYVNLKWEATSNNRLHGRNSYEICSQGQIFYLWRCIYRIWRTDAYDGDAYEFHI